MNDIENEFLKRHRGGKLRQQWGRNSEQAPKGMIDARPKKRCRRYALPPQSKFVEGVDMASGKIPGPMRGRDFFAAKIGFVFGLIIFPNIG